MPDVRPIDANALIEKLKYWRVDLEDVDMNDGYDVGSYATMGRAIMISENAPVLDYAPVRHGRLEHVGFLTCKCSECETVFHELPCENYCPNCGAMMDGGTE